MMKINFYSKFLFFLFVLLAFAKCDSSPPPKLSFEGIRDFDLEEALRESKRDKKPLLIYFTGYACVNCRKMENGVLADKKVVELIQSDYIFTPLYVDDRGKTSRKLLTEKYRIRNERFCKYDGCLHNNLQIRLTQQGSNPLLAIVKDDEITEKTISYTEDVSFLIASLETQKNPYY